MRVIAGSAGGRRLRGPKTTTTRPTSDLVRGAIFSMVENLNPDIRSVLDLYAGTGALGIEALSRGADICDFIDESRSACTLIRRNLDNLALGAETSVLCRPVGPALEELSRSYDLVLADPPYATERLTDLLAVLLRRNLVEKGGLVVVEHGRRVSLPDRIDSLERVRQRRHADTMVSIFIQE